MKTYFESCDDKTLEVLLRGDEESAEFALAASHLDSCERCQSRLSDLAAAPREWKEARELLTVADADASYASECRDCSWSVTAGPAISCSQEAMQWTESSVRQFLAPPSHPEMLGRLGRYEIERIIGAGGMGVVFKGFDTELNRPVAIKMLAPHLAGHGAARQRFAREARAAAAVVHEHVVAIHSVESEGTSPFLVMKFVAGESLQARIDRNGPLELCEILRIGLQTASGLAAAHAQGLVHRDVKPSNILLDQGVERALLTDFGLARASDDASLTHTGYMPGTPHYMSPEQARGDSVDARSDLFSLGSVMYTMCTGRPPFRADSGLGILRRITDNNARPIREMNPAIPEWLARIVERLHAKDPTDRFPNAAALATVLEGCLAHCQQPTVVPLPEECRSRPSIAIRQLNWTFLAVVVLSLAAAIGAVGSAWYGFPRPSELGNQQKQTDNAESSQSGHAGPLSSETEWDLVDEHLGQLLEDSQDLESESKLLWDRNPHNSQKLNDRTRRVPRR